MPDKLSFGSLRKILLDLGFVETVVPGSHLLFEHSSSGTVLLYREYQPGDCVSWADVAKTRRFLDEKGIVDTKEFEALLHKTPV